MTTAYPEPPVGAPCPEPMVPPCAWCAGDGTTPPNAYTGGGVFYKSCQRCTGSGVEPDSPVVHAGLVLRNRRSGKVWTVYGSYPADWGLHRMVPSRRGGHYVWQIIHRTADDLLDEHRWTHVGFGDAWDHALMESDAL